ncbi:MAG: cob(I)yrinic acid a,c-diamide adenosyltransferase [Candidatus Bathyarchaeota archaeon]
MRGIVQVYTGKGKGKTTAALGLALRATGHGFQVYMIQFMKGTMEYGEILSAKKLDPNFKIVQFGRPEFVNKKNPAKIDVELAKKALEHAREILMDRKFDMVILDEINVAVDFGLISKEDVIELIKNKPENVELVLTGRNAHPDIVSLADLVSDVRKIKHPYSEGFHARKGIEY